MNNAQTKNIVRLDWLSNRTPSGRRSATRARKLAQYFALGRGRAHEQELRPQRGQWLDPTGRPCTHEEVLQWVREQGMSHEMTYQFILSVKDTELTAEAFNRAMAAGGPLFDEWRLIQHMDTQYPHAHALAFGDRPVQIKSEAFQSWWLAVRQALEREQAVAIEMQREQALQRDAALAQEAASREQAERLAKQVEAEIAPPEVEREQDQDMGWDMGF